ncbi:head GIN domain-containing protein [Pontibacter sp. H259]|uniref:head GIN domain-containing protein n=1 Tax=Pontibacter sp. H259 TaxID=3133421 RepID=UPI0030BE6047
MKIKTTSAWKIGNRLLLVLASLMLLGSCEDKNCIKGEGPVETRLLNLDSFSRIEANGDFNVFITQGPTQKVEVRGEPNILDQLQTDITNSTWKITHDNCVRRSKEVEVFITLPVYESLYLNGSGYIQGQQHITASDLDIAVNGSGKISLDVDASKIISRVTGSGKVHLQGSAPVHRINMSGSGRAETYGLASENVSVTLSGSGVAQVSAATLLDVSISGSGIVYYKGEPTVNQEISGSGKVVKQ